jgi:hypothetical protein
MSPTLEVSQEDIQKALDELKEISEKETRSYLEKLIDFLKWTTTIALGALLWEGTNYHSVRNVFWVNISLVLFGFSIIVSFVFIILILDWMNSESKLTIDHQESLKSIIPGAPYTREAGRAQGEIITRLSAKYRQLSQNLTIYQYLMSFHGICLVGGVTFFIMAIAKN